MTRTTVLILAITLAPALALAQNGGTAKNNKKQGNTSTTTTTPATTLDKAPIAKNIKDFAKTPQGQARAKKFNKNFGGADGSANKDVKYSDGTAVHLKMVKNPS